MAFTYPPSGGTTSGGPSSALQIGAEAPALFYTSRGDKGDVTTGWGVESYLSPISFNRDMTVTRVAQRFNSIPNSGVWANGGSAWYYIYDSYSYNGIEKPKNLVSNVGLVSVTDATGTSATFIKTLPSYVIFEANKIYWIGSSHGVSNGSGGVTGSYGLAQYRLVTDGGEDPLASAGVPSNEIPFVTLGFASWYAEEIALAPTWGTAPATLSAASLFPQAAAPLVFVEGEPV